MNTSSSDHGVLFQIVNVLGAHPRWFGVLSGIMLAGLVFAGCAWMAVGFKIQQVDADHHRVFERMRDSQADLNRLLDELNASYRPVCSADNLKRLNSLLLKYRYALHIGLLDEQGRLYCNTSMGLFPRAVELRGRIIDGSIGRYHLNFPRRLFSDQADDNDQAIATQRGPFLIWPNGWVTYEYFQQYTDAVWAGSSRQRQRVYQGSRSQALDEQVTPATPHLRFDGTRGHLLITNLAPGISPISAQSVVYLADLYSQQLLAAWGLISLCLLLGGLTSLAVTTACRAMRSMNFRIRYLCNVSHVVCHYQPIVELSSGRVVGCEVLARLQDGKRLLYPDQFIAALDRQKLTWAFDAAVSQSALKELGVALPVQSEGLIVALNFFPGSLNRDRIHAHLQDALRSAGRTDLRIKLEITEYEFSEELEPEIRKLRADGYMIAIDDFGTGYSNLGIVKRIAPDVLKIDKSFVFEMEDATVRSSLIPEIIGIARAIRCDVVAEGIETPTQAIQLRALGVRYGQGYYFMRPAPVAEFVAYLSSPEAKCP